MNMVSLCLPRKEAGLVHLSQGNTVFSSARAGIESRQQEWPSKSRAVVPSQFLRQVLGTVPSCLRVIPPPDLFKILETILLPSTVSGLGPPWNCFRSFAFLACPSVSGFSFVVGGSGVVLACLLVMFGTSSFNWKAVLPFQCSFDRWFVSSIWL